MREMRDFKDFLIESLKNPEEAATYLEVAMEEYEKDKDSEAFLRALRDVAKARGGISKLAKETNLNRQNLYRSLSSRGNPRLNTLETILSALGFRLSIVPLETKAT